MAAGGCADVHAVDGSSQFRPFSTPNTILPGVATLTAYGGSLPAAATSTQIQPAGFMLVSFRFSVDHEYVEGRRVSCGPLWGRRRCHHPLPPLIAWRTHSA